MTRRIAIPFVVAAMLSGTAGRLNAQHLSKTFDPVEIACRNFGYRVGNLEAAVLKRLDEIRPKGKDAADRSRKFEQEMIVAKANKAYEEAQLTAEVAEVAIKEYTEGVYKQDLETVEGEIALAKADLARAGDVFDVAKRRGGEIPLVIQLQLKKAQFTVEQTETKKEVLVRYTKEKCTRELKAAWEKAKSIALAKKADALVEQGKLEKIVREIANPPTPTDTERKALAALDRALKDWKKLLADGAAFTGNAEAKFAAFSPRFVEFDKSLGAAERAWDDAQDERLRAQDAEVEMRIRDVLGIKPPSR